MLGSNERFATGFHKLEVWYGQMATVHVRRNDTSDVQILGHSGSNGTVAWVWPKQNVAVLYFTRSRGGTTSLRIEHEIDRPLFDAKSVVQQDVPANITPLLGKYVANFGMFGMFENEEFEIAYVDDKLVLDIPSLVKFELVFDKETRWVALIARNQVQLLFAPDKDGTVDGFKLFQHGAALEVPRLGTRRAKQLAEDRKPTPHELSSLEGTYDDPDSGGNIDVLVKKDNLYIKSGNQLVALRPSREPNVWHVRQMPGISMVVQRDDDGSVISMTRIIGDQKLVRKKIR